MATAAVTAGAAIYSANQQSQAANQMASAQAGMNQAQLENVVNQQMAQWGSGKERTRQAGGGLIEAQRKFGEETAQAAPELQQLQKDIMAGNTEAMQRGAGQMQAGFAQQGLRGGQAATQLRRGIGEMATGAQRDINKVIAEDAQRRQAERAAYQQMLTGLTGGSFYNQGMF